MSDRKILDSGSRTEFETGAVRDVRVGKGRMDLCPLDIIGKYIQSDVLQYVDDYQHRGDTTALWGAIEAFCKERGWDINTAIIEVSMHYEEGCNKYGDFNWQKGIPMHCYVDSACRHYIKWRRGDDDEPHDRAVIWNLLSGIWTHVHKPEMIDIEIMTKATVAATRGTTTVFIGQHQTT